MTKKIYTARVAKKNQEAMINKLQNSKQGQRWINMCTWAMGQEIGFLIDILENNKKKIENFQIGTDTDGNPILGTCNLSRNDHNAIENALKELLRKKEEEENELKEAETTTEIAITE